MDLAVHTHTSSKSCHAGYYFTIFLFIMKLFYNGILLTFVPLKHITLNQISQKAAVAQTFWETRRKREQELEGSSDNERSPASLCVR